MKKEVQVIELLKKSVLIILLAFMTLTMIPASKNAKPETAEPEYIKPENLQPMNEMVIYPPVRPRVFYKPTMLAQTAGNAKEIIVEEPETEEVYAYSDDEKELIARVVYAEARGERFEGQVAVAQVVINRFESGRFGKTVKKIVFAKHQFAVSSKYNEKSMQAVETAIEERIHPENMFYFQVSKRKKWRNFVFYDRIGNHNFFCSKK